jgi:hypothetical protein
VQALTSLLESAEDKKVRLQNETKLADAAVQQANNMAKMIENQQAMMATFANSLAALIPPRQSGV